MRKVVVGAPKKEEETQLKHGLKRLGFGEITTCSDGNAAVALAYDELPDLVILDA